MVVPLQLGFMDFDQIYAKKRTGRQLCLDLMEITVPWKAVLALIEPVYQKPSSKRGRPLAALRRFGFLLAGPASSALSRPRHHPLGRQVSQHLGHRIL